MPSATRLPPLNALRCFEAAARHQHFGRAGDELHLTHGAISRAVSLLAADLGLPLFERRQRRVHLTDAGRALAQSVTEALQDMRRTTERLRAQARQPRGWTLSCESTLLMRWLLPRWPAFHRKLAKSHPRAHIHLVAGGGPFSFSDGIDLAIRRDDFTWGDAMHADALFAEKTGPVCRTELVKRWFTPKQELRAGTPLLHTRTRPDAWRTWARITGATLPEQQRQHQYEHFYFSLQAAIAGLGVAIGTQELVREDLRNGVLAAPLGFVEDGSRYCLLARSPAAAGSVHALLLTWLLSVSEKA